MLFLLLWLYPSGSLFIDTWTYYYPSFFLELFEGVLLVTSKYFRVYFLPKKTIPYNAVQPLKSDMTQLIRCYYLIHQTHPKFCNWVSRSNLCLHVAFNYTVFNLFFHLEQLLSLLSIMVLTFLKSTGQLHWRMFFIWVYLLYPHEGDYKFLSGKL